MPRTPKFLFPGMTGPWVNDADDQSATPVTTAQSSSTPPPSSATPASNTPSATKNSPKSSKLAAVPKKSDDLGPTEVIVDIDEFHRCLTEANAEFRNRMRFEMTSIINEVRTAVEQERLKRKADFDALLERMERDRDEDRRIRQQHHAEGQAMLYRLADDLQKVHRNQRLIMQGMHNNRSTQTSETQGTRQNTSQDMEAPSQDQ